MKAFLFPGQGSQAKGMGGTLFDHFKELTDKADKILGCSIRELCLDDPRKELNQTQFTQPALYVVNALSYFNKIEELGKKPDFVAGHSLGEFNALLAAECFDFETGLKLVKKRGQLMSQARNGGMAAILNATKEEIEAILKENYLSGIDLANYNSPSQIVISGSKEAIIKAQNFFQKGKMAYYPLNTSGAFHSRYMKSAGEEFAVYLKTFEFSAPKIPVIANISARPYRDDDLVENLSDQITGPVRWYESIQYLMELGNMDFEEVGHGNILKKLVARIQQEAPVRINKNQSFVIKKSLSAEEKVKVWNQQCPVGTKVKSTIIGDAALETRTEAIVLFGHRAAVYMKGYNGYFDLDEVACI